MDCSETKQKNMTQQINCSLIEDTDMMEDLIRTEIMNIHSHGEIQQWTDEYEQIMREVNQYLVSQLLDSTKWNEELCYERAEQFQELSIEKLA